LNDKKGNAINGMLVDVKEGNGMITRRRDLIRMAVEERRGPGPVIEKLTVRLIRV
jgi:hypothetical protein